MSQLTIFGDTPGVISSLESGSGIAPLSKLGGRKTAKSGPPLAPANHLAVPAVAKAKRTKGIYGQSSLVSSPHDDLSFLLASRYREQTASLGSTMYSMTWEIAITPRGRRVPRLAASARRIEESGCTGWPSPQERDWKGPQGRAYKGEAMDLPSTTLLCEPWATPEARDWKNGSVSQETMERNARPLNEQVVAFVPADAALSAWSTPNVPNGGRTLSEVDVISRGQTDKGKRQVGLENEAKLTAWASPQARDHFPAHTDEYIAEKKAEGHGMRNLNDEARLTATGETPPGSTAEMKSIGQLNARHSAWLMGIPEIWDVSAWAIPKRISPTRSKKKAKPESSDSEAPAMQSSSRKRSNGSKR